MLDLYTRTAILRLSKEGHESIKIAKTLGLSRNAVRKVIRSGQVGVAKVEREKLLTGSLELVRTLYDDCRGNLVRVGELRRTGHVPVLLERDANFAGLAPLLEEARRLDALYRARAGRRRAPERLRLSAAAGGDHPPTTATGGLLTTCPTAQRRPRGAIECA